MKEAIDVVYLWVDGADPQLQNDLQTCLRTQRALAQPSSLGPHRFRDNGELKYSLRSLEAFAPWVGKVHIVMNQAPPAWLDTSHDRLSIVSHEQIFSDTSNLPTFNSNAIELQLHRIPNLSRRFLYFNDDVFLGSAISRSDFITSSGGQHIYFEPITLPTRIDEGLVHDRAYAHTQRIVARLWGQQSSPLLLAHVPQLYDKDILAYLEGLLAEEFQETSSHRFRSETDLVLRILYFFFLLESQEQRGKHAARRLPWGSPDYSFICLNEHLWAMWHTFLAVTIHSPKFFCLNDDLGDVSPNHSTLWSLRLFLSLYFPQPSSFEKAL